MEANSPLDVIFLYTSILLFSVVKKVTIKKHRSRLEKTRGVLGPDEANRLRSEALQEILQLAARPRDGFGYRLLPIEALLDIEKTRGKMKTCEEW